MKWGVDASIRGVVDLDVDAAQRGAAVEVATPGPTPVGR